MTSQYDNQEKARDMSILAPATSAQPANTVLLLRLFPTVFHC